MRTITEQLTGLRKIVAQVPAAKLDWQRGDVAVARLGNREIVYAVDNYDLWVDGDLKAVDLDENAAVAALKDGARAI